MQTISQLRKLFSPSDKRKFTGLIFLMTLSALMEMAGIGILVAAVAFFLQPDMPYTQKAFEYFSAIFPGMDQKTFIISGVLTVAILLVAKNLFALLIVHLQSKFIRAKQNELAARMFRSYLYADFRYLKSKQISECNGNIERIPRMCEAFLLPGMQFAADLIVVTFIALTAICLMPLITLGGVAFLLLCGGVIYLLTRNYNNRFGKERQEFEVNENKLRLEGILGAEQIKASGNEDFFHDLFRKAHCGMSSRAAKLYTLGQMPRLFLEIAALLLVLAIFLLLLSRNIGKEGILLVFTVIVATMARILPALSRCHYNLTLIKQNHHLFDSIADELFDIIPENLNSDGTRADASKEICFKNVSFSYSPDQPVLSSIDLTLPPGSTTGIAGRSGRGKTTLVDLLLGLLTPDSGEITAGGVNIYGNLKYWRSQIGYVPQNVFLFEASIRENIALGEAPDDIDDARIICALQRAQLHEFCTDLNAVIHTNGANLSGGQRQRIGIARALYREPALLILDEATSALDSATENAFCDTLNELRGTMTVVVISHRSTTLENCETVINL